MPICALLALSSLAVLAGPEDVVKAESPFKDFSLSQVQNGQVLESRSGPTGSEKDQTVQTCFVIKAPLETVAAGMASWNPADHPRLDTVIHRQLHAPLTAESFKPFVASVTGSKASAAESFIRDSKNLKSMPKEIFVTNDERAKLTKGSSAPSLETIQSAWTDILYHRYLNFTGRGASDFNRLAESGSQLMKTGSGTPSGSADYYVELSKLDKKGTLSEGVSWRTDGESHHLVRDGEFYVSSDYVASFNQSQLWPIKVGGKEVTLVWRVDSVASDEFVGLRGAERLAASGLFLSSVKDTVEAMQKALGR